MKTQKLSEYLKSYIPPAICLLLLIVIFLSGCADSSVLTNDVSRTSPIRTQGENSTLPLANRAVQPSAYRLYIEETDYTFTPLEPDGGCYLGAYVLADRDLNFDSAAFDEKTQKHHALSVYNLRLDESFPMEWTLETLAQSKTPYFIVHPPDWHTPFDSQFLAQAVAGFGKLKTPIFVDFYPDPSIYDGDAETYKQFYRKTRAEFRRNAPNTIFVSSVDRKNIYDYGLYYPGDDVVDWIGIIIYDHAVLSNTNEPTEGSFSAPSIRTRDFMKDFDYFYEEYQHRKPLLISQLAISSFSTIDNKYTVQESAAKLSNLYAALANDYTRVKAVNYMNFNGINLAPLSTVRDNYSLIGEEAMLEAYQFAIENPAFLSDTSSSETGTKKSILCRSFSNSYEYDETIYIPERIITAGIGYKTTCPVTLINNMPCYSVKELIEYGIPIAVDQSTKSIILQKGSSYAYE